LPATIGASFTLYWPSLFAMACGAIGFHLIEGWSILDSLYAAAQTVTTVGYGDVTPATAAADFLPWSLCSPAWAWCFMR